VEAAVSASFALPACPGAVQKETRTLASDPGPSVSSQAVVDDPVRRVELDDRRVRPGPVQRHFEAKPRPGAQPRRLDPGEVEAGDEVVGEGGAVGEVGDELEGPLTRNVDLHLGAERTHGGESLGV
jgi:hypothetical protein